MRARVGVLAGPSWMMADDDGPLIAGVISRFARRGPALVYLVVLDYQRVMGRPLERVLHVLAV